VPGGFGGIAEVFSAGFGVDGGLFWDGAGLLEPIGGVGGFGAALGGGAAGRGGGAAGRGAMLGAGVGDAAGAGAAAVFFRGAAFLRDAAFFFAGALRAVLRRAVFALRAVFFALVLRRFAALRAAALRRFAVFLVERDAFLRPERLDFDLDPERAIKPPVFGLEVAAFRVAFATPLQHARRERFRKGDSDVDPPIITLKWRKCRRLAVVLLSLTGRSLRRRWQTGRLWCERSASRG
jgi:hypothetical protein